MEKNEKEISQFIEWQWKKSRYLFVTKLQSAVDLQLLYCTVLSLSIILLNNHSCI